MAEGTQDGLEVTFSSLVVSLATSAMSHLGEGPGAQVDLALARQTIDVLAMLQEKTKGNLDAEEQRLLETLIYETRLTYVQRAQG